MIGSGSIADDSIAAIHEGEQATAVVGALSLATTILRPGKSHSVLAAAAGYTILSPAISIDIIDPVFTNLI